MCRKSRWCLALWDTVRLFSLSVDWWLFWPSWVVMFPPRGCASHQSTGSSLGWEPRIELWLVTPCAPVLHLKLPLHGLKPALSVMFFSRGEYFLCGVEWDCKHPAPCHKAFPCAPGWIRQVCCCLFMLIHSINEKQAEQSDFMLCNNSAVNCSQEGAQPHMMAQRSPVRLWRS